ncbi:hypothetical protein ABZ897_17200 [Nonomuraea sp. NPDC046802]|uniref:hypothetical protein n=1 Tax=Nonomuraea sp. NPDC046802 TaxID=3154919 RepID=UPI0033ED07AE
MAQEQQPIRTTISTEEPAFADLGQLREILNKNKPELVRQAAGELLTAKRHLDNLVEVIDRHLRELDARWTTGDDAKTVKTSLRRLRDSAAEVSTTISATPADADRCPTNPRGVAPALLLQAHTISVFSGKNLPESADRDINVLEGAFQGGAVGTIGGSIAGPPGAVIGAVVGTLAGGVTALFTDGPFANLVGDSKEEKDRKAAKEHIRLLTEATRQNNEAFPDSLRTDVPQFEMLNPRIPEIPFNGGDRFDGVVPAGFNQPINSPRADLDGLGYPNQDGLRDPNLHQIPGLGNTGPGNGYPDGSGVGAGPDGSLGGAPDTDLSGVGANTPGGPGTPSGNIPDANVNAPQTSLASMPDPSLTGPPSTNLPNTTGIGSPYGGGTPSGGGFGNGMAGAAANALRGMGNQGMFPMIPPVGAGGQGRKGEQEESTRTTWLVEDEDYFMSDETTTNPYIRGDSKGKA